MITKQLSPSIPPGLEYIYNSHGEEPPAHFEGREYDEITMFPNYDREGYDSDGYRSVAANGDYVGIGLGVDRNGMTKLDYDL